MSTLEVGTPVQFWPSAYSAGAWVPEAAIVVAAYGNVATLRVFGADGKARIEESVQSRESDSSGGHGGTVWGPSWTRVPS